LTTKKPLVFILTGENTTENYRIVLIVETCPERLSVTVARLMHIGNKLLLQVIVVHKF